jgi:hypothetical protein
VQCSLRESDAWQAFEPISFPVMWVMWFFLLAVFVIALDPADMDMPISLGWIYNDVTDFGFMDKPVKLSGIDGHSPLLRIRECLSNPLLAAIRTSRTDVES